jgi:CTP:molybdopterin cytidylyltransferase MocA
MNDEHDGPAGRGPTSTAVVVLAAGAGSRFRDPAHDTGRHAPHKLLAVLPATSDRPRETVAARAIARAIIAAIGEVIVVTGAVELPLPDEVIERANADWEQGQMTSVLAGIAEAASRGHHRVVFGLADQPGIEPNAWRAVAEHDGPIAVATYDGRRGNPVRLDEEVWNLLPAGGDEGARVLMRNHPHLVREVPCTGSPADIDTAEDLRQWQSS